MKLKIRQAHRRVDAKSRKTTTRSDQFKASTK